MESRFGTTDFAGLPHAELYRMLHEGDPERVQAAAQRWRQVANWLNDSYADLKAQHKEFRNYWDGANEQNHAEMVDALVEALYEAERVARQVADQLGAAGEALAKAQRNMGKPAAPAQIPQPDPALLEAAFGKQPDGVPWAEWVRRRDLAYKQLQAFQQQAYQQVQAAVVQGQVAAVQVMEELRDAYLNVRLPVVPEVAAPPTIGLDGSPVFASNSGGKLFGQDFYQNGLESAAGMASAAAGLLPTYGGYPGAPGYGGYPGVTDPLDPYQPPSYEPSSFEPSSYEPLEFKPSSLDDYAGSGIGPYGGGGLGSGGEPARAVGSASLAAPAAGLAGPAVAGLASAGVGGAGMGMAGMPIMPGMMGGMGMGGAEGTLTAKPPPFTELVFDQELRHTGAVIT
jgi:uncharacterized protein YukE